MDIVLALLRTLVFVVATVAATVYVGRRIGRGHALLWTGSTLMALHWLIDFGWTSYRAGSANAPSDAAGWVVWAGSLLPFLAALAFIWGIGQAAGFPSRNAPAAGPRPARTGASSQADHAPAPGGGPAGATPVPAPAHHGSWQPSGGSPAADTDRTPRVPGTPTEHPHRHRPRPPGLVVPHAVPVVMTPTASHHSPPDPDPVVDLGPDEPAVPSGGPAVPRPEPTMPQPIAGHVQEDSPLGTTRPRTDPDEPPKT